MKLKNVNLKNIAKLLVLAFVLSELIGCSAAHTSISKRNLDVQTKMSSTVFLDPVSPEKKTIYVQVRNTSDKPGLEIEGKIKAALLEKGYEIVNNPDRAHYLLQANLLQIGNSDLRAAHNALDGGFGAAAGGAIAGGAIGGLASNGSGEGIVAGALIGGVIGTISDAMVKDVNYTAITDVQISERVGKSLSVREKTKSHLQQGTSGGKEVTSTEKTQWKRYQTRVVSTANKSNLKFEQASNELINGLARSVAGIF